ncbi:Methylamine utilisation protein MauE [Desulfofundulus thermosubterraneus DSM 16057]|uniref:Methylamine utilisation protein MauE n=1 Tax=Desulfofundulus thermosubterraneus DSM 16057 TaxID=1121432 RepID=A0A1M6MYF6_9FIRM|nr:Methylamine utilisation protein MauE [Desulfofundulus thermosubterraneus DSM 16057]
MSTSNGSKQKNNNRAAPKKRLTVVALKQCLLLVIIACLLGASVYNYKLLPDELIGPVAVAIPWIETLAGVCLLLGLNTKGGALAISGLLAMFITILIVSAARGLDVECGCFSGVERTVGFLAIFEDMVMLTGALFVLYFDRVKLTPYTFLTRRNKS